ncbi:MAG: hypothetical protein Q8R82_03615, partial [Hyphomonadaceae bacterium]|nr:hypothetical protein [Hyphomonadaceae bacterium]
MTILSLSGVAVAAPLLLLIDEPWSFALAVLGAGAPLIGLAVLVRQLSRAAAELRASVGDGATARKDGSA